MEMASFQCITSPLRLFQGAGSIAALGKELERAGSQRAVIMCGSSLSRQEALLGKISKALGPRLAGVFSGVKAHSPIPAVEAGAVELRRLDADAVIAIGGGSAIVTARAASILLAEGLPIEEMCTVIDSNGALKSPRLMAPKLPQFVVPTTPTTAAVKAGSAVFDPAQGERLALFDPKTRAHAIFIDPEMVSSAPRALIVSAAVNTLSTAIEGLLSRTGNPIADAQLMHSIRLLGEKLSEPQKLDDPSVRGEIAVAAILCGQGTDHTGAGITTVLGHALGARFDVENGTINAIVLPHVLAFNARHAEASLQKVGAALGLSQASTATLLPALIERLEATFLSLGIPLRLRDASVPAEPLAEIAGIAMGDWFLRGNPRPVQDSNELFEILQKAW